MNQVIESTSSKREERWFLVRLVVLAAIALGGFLLLTSLRRPAGNSKFPRAKLPDGTWLVARSVTVGTSHAIEIPYPFDVQLSRFQRSYVERHSTTADRMVVWLTRENDRGEVLDLDWFGRCELEVAGGARFWPNSYHRQTVQRNSSGGSGCGASGFSNAKPFGGNATKPQMELVRFELPLMRPRDGMMSLKVFDGGKQIVAQVQIPYPPLPKPIPDDWEPEPLPATRVDGPVTVILSSLEFRTRPDEGGIQVTPVLRFQHEGKPSTAWEASYQLEDVLGNVSQPWNCDLSTLESAWKLHLTMHQSREGQFLPAETRKLPLKPLAAPKTLVLLTETHTVNGSPISLVGLGGPGPMSFTLPNSQSQFTTGTYQPGQRGSGISSTCSGSTCNVELSSGHPFLITNDVLPGRGHVQLVVRDQSGEVLSQGYSGTAGLLFWFFEPRETSTSIEIEIISQVNRHAEFLIAPPKPEEIKMTR